MRHGLEVLARTRHSGGWPEGRHRPAWVPGGASMPKASSGHCSRSGAFTGIRNGSGFNARGLAQATHDFFKESRLLCRI